MLDVVFLTAGRSIGLCRIPPLSNASRSRDVSRRVVVSSVGAALTPVLFPLRAPESAPLKSKMIYASSKDAIKKKFTGESTRRGQRPKKTSHGCRSSSRLPVCVLSSGIKHEWQVNGLDDIQDRATLAEKLGGNVVVSLEGKPL